MWKHKQALSLIVTLAALASCGAKLPREVSITRPSGLAEELDLTQVNFVDLNTGVDVNLGAYMKEKGLKHMLLTFGSKGCVACMEKAHYLQANLVGHYELLGSGGSTFEFHGVNTDPERSRKEVLQLVKTEQLDHITWADRSDDSSAMMRFFQPAGMSFSVPLTIMINDKGILWRISSKEIVGPDDIIRRVAKTLGEDVNPLPPPPPKPGGGEIPWSALAEEQPGRLKSVMAQSCDASPASDIHSAFGDAALKFIVVDGGDCDAGSVCDQNRATIQSFLASCQSQAGGCGLVTLADTQPGAAACANGVRRGGKEFFSTFADHFNWNYGPVWTNGIHLPEVKGPLVLAFDAEGKLVFSKEGLLVKSELDARWQNDQLKNRAIGPAFEVYTAQGVTSTSTWRHQAKYSIVIFFGESCESCHDNITQWHKPDGLLAYCKARPDFCQILAVENTAGWDPAAQRFATISANLRQHFPQWDIPLAVDMFAPESAIDGWFMSWVEPRFEQLASYRSIVFDREGKVRGSWLALPAHADEPMNLLKKLEP